MFSFLEVTENNEREVLQSILDKIEGLLLEVTLYFTHFS